MREYNAGDIIKVIFTAAFLGMFAIVLFLGAFTGGFQGKGHGTHYGYITSVEQVGTFLKTYRAYVKTSTQSSQEDKYCVIDESLIDKLNDLARSGKRVEIDYKDQGLVWRSECDDEPTTIVGAKEIQE